jgi:hypothetical protein
MLGYLHKFEEIRKMHNAGDIGIGEFNAAAEKESMVHNLTMTLTHSGTIAK